MGSTQIPAGNPVDVVCLGILVADFFPNPIERVPEQGELMKIESLALSTGGCAANTAGGLNKLGIRTGVIGKVGGDVFGRFIREDLHNRGIDTSRISESQKSETSKTIIITVEGEDRRYLHLLGANADFELEDVDLSYATSGKILYVGGFLGMAGFSAKDCHHLFRHAREKKVTTVLDVITPGPGDYFEMFRDVLPQVDVFLPNTDEAEVICGEREPEKQADCFLDLGAGTVVITMGTEGVLAKSSEGTLRVGRYAVPFVDGSGAGDAFDAGLLYALLQEQPLDEALRYASAMGAACVREVGCLDSLFSQEELTAFVRQHSLPMEVRSG